MSDEGSFDPLGSRPFLVRADPMASQTQTSPDTDRLLSVADYEKDRAADDAREQEKADKTKPFGVNTWFCITFTFSTMFYAILSTAMLLMSYFYGDKGEFDIGPFITFIRYDIVLAVLVGVRFIIVVVLALTQFQTRAGNIGGALILVLYALVTTIFAVLFGLIIKGFTTLLALWGVATAVMYGVMIVVGMLNLCKCHRVVRNLKSVETYFRVVLFVLTVIIVLTVINPRTRRWENYIFPAIVALLMLYFLLVIIVDEMFNEHSQMRHRMDAVESTYYLMELQANILFMTVATVVTFGITSVHNPAIMNNMLTGKKAPTVGLEPAVGVPPPKKRWWERMASSAGTMFKRL